MSVSIQTYEAQQEKNGGEIHKAARRLLLTHRTLTVQITITLTNSARRARVSRHTVVLQGPR